MGFGDFVPFLIWLSPFCQEDYVFFIMEGFIPDFSIVNKLYIYIIITFKNQC